MESSKSAASPGREGAERVWPVALFTSVDLVGTLISSVMASLSPQQAQQIRASTDSVFWDEVPV